MFKRVLLLAFLCIYGVGLFAENGPTKDYPGMNVVLQEIENHNAMLKTLEKLLIAASQGKQPEKSSIESLLNYTKAALISLEYLDGVWECKGTGQVDGRDCNGCRGSGWGNAHPNSPGR